MHSDRKSAGTKFREAIQQGTIAVPGVFNALTARMAEELGFAAVYQSGAALSAGLAALPDVGLITQTEFARQGEYLAQAVSIPVISDADTGFGEPLSVERTIREYERAGLAGLHLEDQQLPKRCGHLSGKGLVTTAEMVAKIKAAVGARVDPNFVIIARTDARASEGMQGAIERAQAYVEAGADMIFPEALQDISEFQKFARDIRVPLIANMTEFGKSQLLSVSELSGLGYAAVLFPVTIFRVAMKAAREALKSLQTEGSQASFINQMQTRAELYELLKYEGFDERDRSYFGKK